MKINLLLLEKMKVKTIPAKRKITECFTPYNIEKIFKKNIFNVKILTVDVLWTNHFFCVCVYSTPKDILKQLDQK